MMYLFVKAAIATTPLAPTPPPRMDSSHTNSNMSTFKPDSENNSGKGSPGIPTPDYDTMTTINSSLEPKIEMNKIRISSPEPHSSSKVLVKKTKSADPRTKTFSKRHPPVIETTSNGTSGSGSVNSFKVSSTENLEMQEKVSTANYFKLVRHIHASESEAGDQFNFGPSQIQVRNTIKLKFKVSWRMKKKSSLKFFIL